MPITHPFDLWGVGSRHDHDGNKEEDPSANQNNQASPSCSGEVDPTLKAPSIMYSALSNEEDYVRSDCSNLKLVRITTESSRCPISPVFHTLLEINIRMSIKPTELHRSVVAILTAAMI